MRLPAAKSCLPFTVRPHLDGVVCGMSVEPPPWGSSDSELPPFSSGADDVPSGARLTLASEGFDERIDVLHLGRTQVEAQRTEPTEKWPKGTKALELGGTDQGRGVAVAAGDGDDPSAGDLLELFA